MKRLTTRLLALVGMTIALGLALPTAARAQGPFADVPTDHWAYDAVSQLATAGIFTGYPDGTFGGKRTLTGYEFAVAIQRMLQDVQGRVHVAVVSTQKGMPPSEQTLDSLWWATLGLDHLTIEFFQALLATGVNAQSARFELRRLGLAIVWIRNQRKSLPNARP